MSGPKTHMHGHQRTDGFCHLTSPWPWWCGVGMQVHHTCMKHNGTMMEPIHSS